MTTATKARQTVRKTARTGAPVEAVKRPETRAERRQRIIAEWVQLQAEDAEAHLVLVAGGKRVQPPEGMQGWTRGDHSHQVSPGEVVDCPSCAAWVASMTDEERVTDMSVRAAFELRTMTPDMLTAPAELLEDYERRKQMYQEARLKASWRLVP